MAIHRWRVVIVVVIFGVERFRIRNTPIVVRGRVGCRGARAVVLVAAVAVADQVYGSLFSIFRARPRHKRRVVAVFCRRRRAFIAILAFAHPS